MRFFIILLLFFAASKVMASNLVFFICERFSLDHNGFTSIPAAESWYNKSLMVKIDIEKQKGYYKNTSSNVIVKSNGKRFELKFPRKSKAGNQKWLQFYFLPNGEVHTELKSTHGFNRAGGAKYKCDGWPLN